MKNPTDESRNAGWRSLFQQGEASQYVIVIRRHGQPLLVLAGDASFSVKALALYPAQCLLARFVRDLLRLGLRMGLQPLLRRELLHFSPEDPFWTIISKTKDKHNNFAIFCGNPKGPGQRFMVLTGTPTELRVIKAGSSAVAQELVLQEANFLRKVQGMPYVLDILDQFQTERICAFSLPFIPGDSPAMDSVEEVAAVMLAWVLPGELPLNAIPMWKRLYTKGVAISPSLRAIQDHRIATTLFHGDFVPWNIKVTPRGWVVLDWERGENPGIPGWDWFHFIIQPRVLILRLAPTEVLRIVEETICSPLFKKYAEKTKIEGIEWALLEAYLDYTVKIFQPSEGLESLKEIHRIVSNRNQRPDSALQPAHSLSHRFKLTIVTPSHDQLRWLKLCVASVADQQGVDCEHIIQDAETEGDLCEWVTSHSTAKLFVERDSGMYDAINKGFSKATGDVVAWLNCDEQYLPGALAKVTRFFEEHPDVDLLFGDAVLINEEGALLSYRRAILPSLLHIQLSHLNTLSCATFVRRSVIERGFQLKTEWKAIADVVWVTDMLKAKLRMALLPEPLAAFTITQENLGQSRLAFDEGNRWQQQTITGWMRALRIPAIALHRIRKLLNGAYSKRDFATEVYTHSSRLTRRPVQLHKIPFSWTKSQEAKNANRLH